MKLLHPNALIFLFVAALAACSGSSTQYVDYAPIDTTPKLDMKAAIYQSTLSSGYKLTITTDQIGTSVNGAYTIKNGAVIISSGTVSNVITNLTFLADSSSPCTGEQMSALPSSITTTGADLTLTGFGCTETPVGKSVATATHVSKITPSAKLISQGTTNANELITISTASADNVNFVGSIAFFNPANSKSATGTIVGTTQNNVAATRNINDADAVVLTFDRVSNYSGNFIDTSATRITGQISTTAPTLAGPFTVNGITVTPFNINTALAAFTIIDPTKLQTTQGYSPL